MRSGLSANEGIEKLFELYSDDIYRYAHYSAPRSIDPKDVVQEVFFRAYRAWNSFRGESNAKTWLLQIAKNYVYDLLRKKRVEREYQQKHKPDLSDVSVPLNTLVELEDAVLNLNRDQRQVFVLRAIQDLSVEETASILGWSQAKVKTTFHRAIRELRSFLKEPELPLTREEEGDRDEDGRRDSATISTAQRNKTQYHR